jgi:glycosyltransferase involved in cell wall biosynthesis
VRQYLGDERIRLVSQANAGPGPARNHGARLGDAPFLAFPDADDRWLPEFLETTLRALHEHPDCVMVATNSSRGPWGNRAAYGVAAGIEPGVWRCPTDIEPSLLRAATAFFTPSAVLIRRETFDSFGGFYDRSYCTYAEDSYLYLRVIMQHPVFRILEPLFWRNIDGSELAEGRTSPYPVSPHIRHGDELLAECPPSHRETLRRFIDWHAVWEARRLARQGEGRQAVRLLRQRFPEGAPDEHTETVRTILRWARAWPLVRLARRGKTFIRRVLV